MPSSSQFSCAALDARLACLRSQGPKHYDVSTGLCLSEIWRILWPWATISVDQASDANEQYRAIFDRVAVDALHSLERRPRLAVLLDFCTHLRQAFAPDTVRPRSLRDLIPPDWQRLLPAPANSVITPGRLIATFLQRTAPRPSPRRYVESHPLLKSLTSLAVAQVGEAALKWALNSAPGSPIEGGAAPPFAASSSPLAVPAPPPANWARGLHPAAGARQDRAPPAFEKAPVSVREPEAVRLEPAAMQLPAAAATYEAPKMKKSASYDEPERSLPVQMAVSMCIDGPSLTSCTLSAHNDVESYLWMTLRVSRQSLSRLPPLLATHFKDSSTAPFPFCYLPAVSDSTPLVERYLDRDTMLALGEYVRLHSTSSHTYRLNQRFLAFFMGALSTHAAVINRWSRLAVLLDIVTRERSGVDDIGSLYDSSVYSPSVVDDEGLSVGTAPLSVDVSADTHESSPLKSSRFTSISGGSPQLVDRSESSQNFLVYCIGLASTLVMSSSGVQEEGISESRQRVPSEASPSSNEDRASISTPSYVLPTPQWVFKSPSVACSYVSVHDTLTALHQELACEGDIIRMTLEPELISFPFPALEGLFPDTNLTPRASGAQLAYSELFYQVGSLWRRKHVRTSHSFSNRSEGAASTHSSPVLGPSSVSAHKSSISPRSIPPPNGASSPRSRGDRSQISRHADAYDDDVHHDVHLKPSQHYRQNDYSPRNPSAASSYQHEGHQNNDSRYPRNTGAASHRRRGGRRGDSQQGIFGGGLSRSEREAGTAALNLHVNAAIKAAYMGQYSLGMPSFPQPQPVSDYRPSPPPYAMGGYAYTPQFAPHGYAATPPMYPNPVWVAGGNSAYGLYGDVAPMQAGVQNPDYYGTGGPGGPAQ
jgi:hypothetical protein